MHVDFVRDEAKQLPPFERPAGVTACRIWHCKYRSLEGIARLTNLDTLVVATWPDRTLEPLSVLSKLRYLFLLHLPKVTDLAPLSSLHRLETVRLHTLPSWDSSGKRTEVTSLEPLAALPMLKHVELFGVVPPDGSLAPLERSSSLSSVRVSKYDKRERERFYADTGLPDAYAPQPEVDDW